MSHIYLRAAGEFDARRLPGTEGGSNPVFSPDGRTLAFLTPTQLKTIAIDGGAATALARVNDPRGLAWVDDTHADLRAGIDRRALRDLDAGRRARER